MSNENLNLITVIKYLQDQYTLNERNRLNYELLLRSKQLQREKGTSIDNINQTLKQIHIDNNKFNEQSEVDNIIQEAKFKLSTAMKDLDMILTEQEFNNDLTYKKEEAASNYPDDTYDGKAAILPVNLYSSNIPNVDRVILNGSCLFLLDFQNGFLEKRLIDNKHNKLILDEQRKDDLLKQSNNCWYNNKLDNLVCVKDTLLYELENRKEINVSKRDIFYKFDHLCDCKYTNFGYIDEDHQIIKVINVSDSAKYAVDLQKHGIQKILDLKFGITETSLLVLSDKSLFIIDYVKDEVLKETNINLIGSSPLKYGKITISTDLSFVVLSHILHNKLILTSIYSLENFNLLDCAHKVYGLNEYCSTIVASSNRLFYKFDNQIQIRQKDGTFIGKISWENDKLFSDIVVDNQHHLYFIYKNSEREKLTIEEYDV